MPVLAIAIAVLTGETTSAAPGPGLDASWAIALQLGAVEGFQHGTEFIFSYGPLGFLDEPVAIAGVPAALGGIYEIVLRALLVGSLIWAGRRSFGLLGATVLTLVAMALMPGAEIPLALVALWCIVALGPEPPPWAANVAVIGGAAFSALEVLVKLNIGLSALVLVTVTAVALEGQRLRRAGLAAAGFAGTFAVLWFATAQGLGNLDDFARGAAEIVGGYSSGMQARFPYVGWDRIAAALIVLGTLAGAFLCTRDVPRRRRLGVLAVVALFAYALAKQGFARHTVGHVEAFIGAIVVPWFAFRSVGAMRFVAAAAIPAVALISSPMTGRDPFNTVHPEASFQHLRTLVDPAYRDEARDGARASMRAFYDVDPRILARIGDEPVHPLPWEIGLVWAYGLNWDPLPVIQDYSAYTPALDEANAEALESADGPRFLLRHMLEYAAGPSVAIDGRYQPYDAPAETRALLCNFREAITAGDFQLLERAEDRCGEPRPVESLTAEFGEIIEVPPAGAGEALFMAVEGAGAEGIERLRSTVYRGAFRYIVLDDSLYRLVGANAADGLIVSAPRRADFGGRFALAPNARTVRFASEGGFATVDGPLEIEFYAVPVVHG